MMQPGPKKQSGQGDEAVHDEAEDRDRATPEPEREPEPERAEPDGEDTVDEASKESFPASDAPAWTTSVPG